MVGWDEEKGGERDGKVGEGERVVVGEGSYVFENHKSGP
jgi:hypothetical protein